MQLALAHAAGAGLMGFEAILRREVVSRLGSVWFFLLASATCLIATAYGGGFQSSFETETVLVSSNPLAALNAAVAIFLALILGLRLSTSMSWEREHGTLEVLLIAPVGPRAIVAAKFLAELVVLAVLLLIYAGFLLLAQPLGPGVVRLGDVAALLPMSALLLPLLTLGLLISGLLASVRAAVIAYLVAVALLAGFEGLLGTLQGLQPQDLSLAILYLRAGLEAADRLVGLVSPLAPLADLARGVAFGVAAGAREIASALVLALAILLLAAEAARLRGAS